MGFIAATLSVRCRESGNPELRLSDKLIPDIAPLRSSSYFAIVTTMEALLPNALVPTRLVKIELPSSLVALPHCNPIFKTWVGPKLPFTFGNKMLLEHAGNPVFAELKILRLLESEGWKGVWVSSFGGLKFLDQMPNDATMSGALSAVPDSKRKYLDSIAQQSGKVGGCFDVFAWRESQLLFCEAKRRNFDRLKSTQLRWIESALAAGISPNALLIVEWSAE